MAENKRSFDYWRIPLYCVTVSVWLVSIIFTVTSIEETQPYIYASVTFSVFILNLELKNIIERSNIFLSIYVIINLISCIVSYFIFDDYIFESPRGLYFYGFAIFLFVYTFISVYDKIFERDKPSDN